MTEAANTLNVEEALKEINTKLFEDAVAKAGGKVPHDLVYLIQDIHDVIVDRGYPPILGLALLLFSTVPILDGPADDGDEERSEKSIRYALAGYEAILRSFIGKREYWPYADLKPQEGETVQ